MTLYFFHCSDLAGHYSDTWGLELDDAASALAVAPSFLSDVPPPVDSRWRSVEIEDEMGRPIMAVTLPGH
jgi:hypothetical protein